METLEQVDVIERALLRLRTAGLDEELRAQAQRAAHMLAGSVGTFGFMHASTLARELERELASNAHPQPETLAELVRGLRRELEDASAFGGALPPAELEHEAPWVLVVDRDEEFRERIIAACAERDMRGLGAADADEARRTIAQGRPSVVLLDLSGPPAELAQARELLSELSGAQPAIPVLVLTGSGEFSDRVDAARRGSRAFLPKSLRPVEVLGAVEQLLAGERLTATRVLVVDDDAMLLEAVRALLRPHGIAITTLADPGRFWAALEEVEPELLILDLDMPGVNGVELCRTVRNDPRWSGLAVMFITASTGAESVELLFNAGADDYVAKPIVGPELVRRVSNRLERVRLLRAQAELDGLTGLLNRVTSEQRLAHLLSLGDRFKDGVALAMIDVDRFKLVNDTYGHATGDAVLRRLGEYVRGAFRGNDVLGRWGGEEFVVGMYGTTCENAELRVADLLERFSKETFKAPDGGFSVTFSAGIAEHQRNNGDLDTLCEAADRALYEAKAAGRSRVIAAT